MSGRVRIGGMQSRFDNKVLAFTMRRHQNGSPIASVISEVIEMNLYVPVGLIVLVLLIVFLVRGF